MAEMTDKQRIAKATALLQKARELHAQEFDVLEECRKILEGEAAIGDTLRVLSNSWCATWQERFGSRYGWGPEAAKNSAHLKRLLKDFTLEDLLQRMSDYLFDKDPFLVYANHPFGLFVSRINRYARQAPVTVSQDCLRDGKHTPPCTTDQEHTQRRGKEMRPS